MSASRAISSLLSSSTPDAESLTRRLRAAGDLAVFTMPDGLGVQLRGVGAPVVLRGHEVEAALDFLLPRLNGRTTLLRVFEAAPASLSVTTLLQYTALLEEAGLAREVKHSECDTSRPEHDDSPMAEFATARVTLIATGHFGRATAALLNQAGCGHLRILAWDDAAPIASAHGDTQVHLPTTSIERALDVLRPWLAESDLVVTATRNAPDALFAALNRACLEHRVPWLRANEAGTLDVGPTVQPFASACFGCLSLRAASANALAIEERLYQDALAGERPAGQTKPHKENAVIATLAASLVVLEATRVLTGEKPTLANTVLSLARTDGAIERAAILPVPACPACGLDPHARDRAKGGGHV